LVIGHWEGWRISGFSAATGHNAWNFGLFRPLGFFELET
jgi:hypothetical protein